MSTWHDNMGQAITARTGKRWPESNHNESQQRESAETVAAPKMCAGRNTYSDSSAEAATWACKRCSNASLDNHTLRTIRRLINRRLRAQTWNHTCGIMRARRARALPGTRTGLATARRTCSDSTANAQRLQGKRAAIALQPRLHIHADI